MSKRTRCARVLPTNVTCGEQLPCPYHGWEFDPDREDRARRLDAFVERLESGNEHKHCLHGFWKDPRDTPDVIDGDRVRAHVMHGEVAVMATTLASCCKCRDVFLMTREFEEKSHGGTFAKLRIRPS